MPTEQIYKTKQRQIILDYLAHVHRQHITAAEICEHFRKCKIQISPATVYRHLEKFISDGIVRKYYMDGIPGACFQYIGICEDCESHIHFKCVECGCLICVEVRRFKSALFTRTRLSDRLRQNRILRQMPRLLKERRK